MTEEKAPTQRTPRRKAAADSEPTPTENTPAKATTIRRSTAATTEKKATSRKAAPPGPVDDNPPARAPVRRKPTPNKESVEPNVTPIRPEERYRMIQSTAYFLAEKDGFQGSAVDYWTQAERQVAEQIGAQPSAE